jgi:hypothetical protein
MPFFDAAYAIAPRSTRLLEAEPDLLGAAAARHPLATHELSLVRLPAGNWILDASHSRPALGFLVIDGLLIRRVALGSRRRAELLGAGDVVRPWDGAGNVVSLRSGVSWEAHAPTRLAVLDGAFVSAASAAPDVLAGLAVRAVERSHRLAVQLALVDVRHVDQRLIALFAHLGDRWGRMTGRGMHLPIRLTHELLAELIGANRPTVTTALGELERAGALERRADRTWVLHSAAGLGVARVRGVRRTHTAPQ